MITNKPEIKSKNKLKRILEINGGFLESGNLICKMYIGEPTVFNDKSDKPNWHTITKKEIKNNDWIYIKED